MYIDLLVGVHMHVCTRAVCVCGICSCVWDYVCYNGLRHKNHVVLEVIDLFGFDIQLDMTITAGNEAMI